VLERVSWWAEVLTVPCVGYAANLDEVAALVQAGTDFVAIGENIWCDPQGIAGAVGALQRIAEPVR
jgi:thiamine monophosphate synthase